MARSARHALVERLLGGRPEQHGAGGHHADHRELRGGGLRAAIFGVSDGLVSNVSLVLGTSGAHPGGSFIRLAGIAGLLGGSFSMAAGEYVSMRAQREAFEREIEVERRELEIHPAAEEHELQQIYQGRGMSAETAQQAAGDVMADPENALSTHTREELGIDPQNLGSPVQAATASFASFAFGALLPLLPFLTGNGGSGALLVAIALTAVGALATGSVLSLVTERPLVLSALRSLAICAVAGGATYAIGTAIGVSTA
ncbi:MAG TPA: VIT1/CCC1 transporter family protein [Acidimicrobiales bacterium]|nr:VIT1/CCC1 transporter family protein [Acidimicrobiales bacterium]